MAAPTTAGRKSEEDNDTKPKRIKEDDDNNNEENSATNNTATSHLAQAAARGTLATLGLRLLSFVCTQWTLRVLDPAALGRTNVRLELMLTTVLFLSREGFRLALTQNVVKENEGTVWLVIPVGTLVSMAAVVFHVWSLAETTGTEENNTTSQQENTDFYLAGLLYCLAAWLELLAEPATLHALRELNVTAKVSAEGTAVVAKTVATVVFLQYLQTDWPVTAFGLAQIVYALSYGLFLGRVTWGRLQWPNVTTTTILHGPTCYFCLIFTLQSCLKHFLTQGDKVVLTSLLHHYDQGVYAMGSAYGSLAARVLFQPVEENSRLLWSRLANAATASTTTSSATTNDENKETNENETSPNNNNNNSHNKLYASYTMIVKAILYIGFIFSFLGMNYSEVLLNLLAGRKWGNNPEAVAVLSAFCVYTAFMAWNGTTEAFVYAVASSAADIGQLSLCHSVVGGLFAVAAPLAVKQYGTIGLVAVNCGAMFLRCAFSVYYAARYFAKHDKNKNNNNPQTGWRTLVRLLSQMFPHPAVMAAFGSSYWATMLSLQRLRETAIAREIAVGSLAWFRLSLEQHISVGVACGIGTLSLAFLLEEEFKKELRRLRAGKMD